jgi:sugar lactone lactonase YvrE
MSIATTIFRKLFYVILLSVLILNSNTFTQTIQVYVSDAGNFSSPPWQILKFDENGENPVVFINTNLAWPQDILFLEDQNVVLISNLNTGRITKHNSSTGEYIEDFATGIGGPTRMKIGADSLLYVLQWTGNGRVKRYELDGTFVDDFTSVSVAQGIGIDWDNDGNLYVSSYGGASVRKFDTNGNDLGVFVNTNLLGPTNIWFDDNGELLVVDYNGTSVKRFDSSGIFVSNFLTGLSQAEGVAFFPNGNILVGNGATHSVKMFDSNGNYIEDFIPNGSGGLITPNAVIIRETDVSSVPGDDNSLNAKSFVLKQNYPNPFNPTTNIGFRISDGGFVSLIVYDILGNEVTKLVNEEKQPGTYEVQFSAKGGSASGGNASGLPSGIYFYQLKADNSNETKKMIYLK